MGKTGGAVARGITPVKGTKKGPPLTVGVARRSTRGTEAVEQEAEEQAATIGGRRRAPTKAQLEEELVTSRGMIARLEAKVAALEAMTPTEPVPAVTPVAISSQTDASEYAAE